MLFLSLRWIFPAGLLLAVAPIQAQSDAAGYTASALLQYRSALEQYRRFEDQPVESWKETNDTVGKIGGWRTYAREARQPAPAGGTAAPAAPGPGMHGDMVKPLPGSHMDHGGKP